MHTQEKVSIAGLDKARVLKALYDAAKPINMGMLRYVPGDMPLAEAELIIGMGTRRFDYVKGRVLKVHLGADEFMPGLYDRDNGQGEAQRVIDALRAAIA